MESKVIRKRGTDPVAINNCNCYLKEPFDLCSLCLKNHNAVVLTTIFLIEGITIEEARPYMREAYFDTMPDAN